MEAKRRSVVKGFTWRVLATTDTVLLSFIFTGSIGTAVSIGGLEVVTKVVWYYFHERVWARIPHVHKNYPLFEKLFSGEYKYRSLIKALSWRFFGAIDTFVIAFLFTGHLGVSSSIGGAELVTKILLYYFHDQLWNYIRWGVYTGATSSRQNDNTIKIASSHITHNPKKMLQYLGVCLLLLAISLSVAIFLHTR